MTADVACPGALVSASIHRLENTGHHVGDYFIEILNRNLLDVQQFCADLLKCIVLHHQHCITCLIEMRQRQRSIVVLHNHFSRAIRPHDLVEEETVREFVAETLRHVGTETRTSAACKR